MITIVNSFVTKVLIQGQIFSPLPPSLVLSKVKVHVVGNLDVESWSNLNGTTVSMRAMARGAEK